VDDQGAEILYVRLHETADESECDGEHQALIYAQVLRVIADRTPGPERNAMIRDFAARIAERKFCRHHWLPIDRLLSQLIQIWKQPVQ
jgi:hypothetical protein